MQCTVFFVLFCTVQDDCTNCLYCTVQHMMYSTDSTVFLLEIDWISFVFPGIQSEILMIVLLVNNDIKI